jgi:hypothetical protein
LKATTANPPMSGASPYYPSSSEEFTAYLHNYVPIKIARALRRKLNRKSPYWESDQLRDVPFLLAVQDFHGPGTMRMVVPATTEYVFGVRHSIVDGKRKIERIIEHRFGSSQEDSGFFFFPGAENVSAVLKSTGHHHEVQSYGLHCRLRQSARAHDSFGHATW